MKIVILNGSPRANGNTAAMVEAFARISPERSELRSRRYAGCAKEAGHAVGEYCGILRYFGAADCGIVTSDNKTNKTEAKLNECYELGRSLM